jgi:tetratricopeptide (TPR) repeat protein
MPAIFLPSRGEAGSLTASTTSAVIEMPAVSTAPVAVNEAALPKALQDALGDLAAGHAKIADARCAAFVRRNNNSAAGWTLWGRAKLAQKEYKQAVRRFNKALKRDPAYSEAFFWKGKTYEAWGKLDEAANEYQAAFHADAANAEAAAAWRNIVELVNK